MDSGNNWTRIVIPINYEINVNGEIRNMTTKELITPRLDKDGYPEARLMIRNSEWVMRIHRIMGTTFIPNPENKPQINHIDGIKTNNNLSNLEWVTHSENQRHAYAKQLKYARLGETNNWAKLTKEDVERVFKMYHDGHILKVIASEVNISLSHVNRLLNGERWGHLKLIKNPRIRNHNMKKLSKIKKESNGQWE
jgi:hypothetical protein